MGTIIPRTHGAGGFTLFVPDEETQDSGLYSRKYLEAQLAVALGGRVAEEIIYGDEEITTGASGDLQRVADIARRMVTQWGFASDSLSPTAWGARAAPLPCPTAWRARKPSRRSMLRSRRSSARPT